MSAQNLCIKELGGANEFFANFPWFEAVLTHLGHGIAFGVHCFAIWDVFLWHVAVARIVERIHQQFVGLFKVVVLRYGRVYGVY